MRDVVFSFVLLIPFAATASGQAWVPEKGEGTLSTSFNYIAFGGHFQSDGSRTPQAASRSRSYLFDLEYGLTDKLAATVSLPVVSARYASTNPNSADLLVLFNQAVQEVNSGFYNHGFLDDGNYHTTFQDFHFDVRYNLTSRHVVVTPVIGATFPSHDYAFVGEAAPGRNLKEFRFGTDLARVLDPFLHKAYVDGQLVFTISEQALQVRNNRTNLSLETGYLLSRRLAVRGYGQWQHTFHGLHFPVDLTTPELTLTHDRLLKANYWHLGGGASYALNSKTEVSADVVAFLSGSDTHYGSGVVLTISRGFQLKPRVHPPPLIDSTR
jgi:hypothetical protein